MKPNTFDDDEPNTQPDGGSCGECGRGLPSWQSDGSLCPRCECAEYDGDDLDPVELACGPDPEPESD